MSITDTCGLCRAVFQLIGSPSQYPAVLTAAGTFDLVCDACQQIMMEDEQR